MEQEVDVLGGFSALAEDLGAGTGSVEGGVSDLSKTFGNDPIKKPPVVDEDDDDEYDEDGNLIVKDDGNDDDDDIEYDEDGNPIENDDDDDDDLTDEEKAAIEAAKNKKSKKTSSKKKTTKKSDDDDDDDDEGFGDAEPEISEYLQEQLYNEFGIELGEEDDRFKSLKDVTEFISEAIEERSKPEFANPEVANIDEYVRNGGNLYDYMSNVYGSIDYNNVDLSNEQTQKAIIKQELLNQGLSEVRVAKKLERFEDMGMLAEEAEDALESLKEFQETEAERLLTEQENQKEALKKANLAFVENVEKELDGMKDVRGIEITKAERDKLYNYIMKPTSNGQTQYQIEYKKNLKNLLESAYFTMNGDKLISKVKRKANSTAAKKLKNKLADKGRRGRNQSTIDSGNSNPWGMLSRSLT